MKKLLVSVLTIGMALGVFTGTPVIEAGRGTYGTTVNADHNGRMTAIVNLPSYMASGVDIRTDTGTIVSQNYNALTGQLTITLEGSNQTYIRDYNYGGELPIVTKTVRCNTSYCNGYLLAGWDQYYAPTLKKVDISVAYDNDLFGEWWKGYLLQDYQDYGVYYNFGAGGFSKITAKFRAYTTATPVYGYQYPIIITYSDITAPSLEVDGATIYTNSSTVYLTGRATAEGSGAVDFKATMGGKTSTLSLPTYGTLMSFSLPIFDVPEGRYEQIPIIVTTGDSYPTVKNSGVIYVDLTKPSAPGIGVTL